MKSFLLLWLPALSSVLIIACSSAPPKYENIKKLETNDEFEQAVKIQDQQSPVVPEPKGKKGGKKGPTPIPKATPSELEKTLLPAKAPEKKAASKKVVTKKGKKGAKVEELPAAPQRRQPDLEDDVGFQGRRPLKDPFRIGEVITHNVHYFKISAGTLALKVKPMVYVNNRKAYNFVTEIKTSSFYSKVYSVDDSVETFVDYETLVPSVYALHVKETGQLREARMLFDENTGQAKFWEKKVTDKNGEEEKKQTWDILPYSQNVFSAIFYIRNFQWEVGKEVAFRVADDEQNLIFKGKCIRREKIDTELGEMSALVIKPEIILKGKFKPVGDIYIWLSDDEHKYPLRIESKIKIGTLVSEVISIVPGQN